MTGLYNEKRPVYRMTEIDPADPLASANEWIASVLPEEVARAQATDFFASLLNPGPGGTWASNSQLRITWSKPDGYQGLGAVAWPSTHICGQMFETGIPFRQVAYDQFSYDFEPVTP